MCRVTKRQTDLVVDWTENTSKLTNKKGVKGLEVEVPDSGNPFLCPISTFHSMDVGVRTSYHYSWKKH